SIGSRGDTSEDGRFLGGGVDEVAIFTNALTAAQIQTIFNSSGMVPIIIVPPVAPAGTLYEGPSYTFTVEAAGVPTLLYQWTKNGNKISGTTRTSFLLNNTTSSDSGTYSFIITNNY